MDRPGSKLHKKEIAEGVSMLEAPSKVVVGSVGYVEAPGGLRALTSMWAVVRTGCLEIVWTHAQTTRPPRRVSGGL